MKIYETPVLIYDRLNEAFGPKGELDLACADVIFELWDVTKEDQIKFHVYTKPGPYRHEFYIWRFFEAEKEGGPGYLNYTLDYESWSITSLFGTLKEILAKLWEKNHSGPYYVECEIQCQE